MTFTTQEEASLKQLASEDDSLLALAAREPEILSKLGASKKTLPDLAAASSVLQDAKMLINQNSSDLSISPSVLHSDFSARDFTTQPQFNNTQKVATTAFVQRALGNFAGNGLTITTNQTIPASVAGYLNYINASAIATLPTTPAIGSTYHFSVNNTGVVGTIRLPAGHSFGTGSTATTADIVLLGEEYFSVCYIGSNIYIPIGGIGASKRSPQNAVSLTPNGYQRFPSGLIIQWGGGTATAAGNLAMSLPIAFPNIHLGAVATTQSEATPALFVSVWTLTPSAIEVRVRNSSGAGVANGVKWLAFGW